MISPKELFKVDFLEFSLVEYSAPVSKTSFGLGWTEGGITF